MLCCHRDNYDKEVKAKMETTGSHKHRQHKARSKKPEKQVYVPPFMKKGLSTMAVPIISLITSCSSIFQSVPGENWRKRNFACFVKLDLHYKGQHTEGTSVCVCVCVCACLSVCLSVCLCITHFPFSLLDLVTEKQWKWKGVINSRMWQLMEF